jgi:hypothetical protein
MQLIKVFGDGNNKQITAIKTKSGRWNGALQSYILWSQAYLAATIK